MRISKELSNKCFNVMDGARQVTKSSVNQTKLDDFFYTINEINGKVRNVNFVGPYQISDYEIANEFQDLIMPVEVRFNSDMWSKNFKSKLYQTNLMDPDNEGKFNLMDPTEFKLFGQNMLGLVKSTPSGYSKLSELRVAKMLSDIDTKAMVEDSDAMYCVDTPTIPVELSIQLYEDFKYTMDATFNFIEWFSLKFTKSKSS